MMNIINTIITGDEMVARYNEWLQVENNMSGVHMWFGEEYDEYDMVQATYSLMAEIDNLEDEVMDVDAHYDFRQVVKEYLAMFDVSDEVIENLKRLGYAQDYNWFEDDLFNKTKEMLKVQTIEDTYTLDKYGVEITEDPDADTYDLDEMETRCTLVRCLAYDLRCKMPQWYYNRMIDGEGDYKLHKVSDTCVKVTEAPFNCYMTVQVDELEDYSDAIITVKAVSKGTGVTWRTSYIEYLKHLDNKERIAYEYTVDGDPVVSLAQFYMIRGLLSLLPAMRYDIMQCHPRRTKR